MAGLLVDGNWTQKDEFAEDDGKYKREDSAFRNWITADGGPGPDGQEAVKAEADRFQSLVETLDESGVQATIELLAKTLESEKKFPQLFEALLMKKRHQLGLALEHLRVAVVDPLQG